MYHLTETHGRNLTRYYRITRNFHRIDDARKGQALRILARLWARAARDGELTVTYE